MASDICLRTIPIVRKETRCRHIGYSFRLAARVLLYAPSHRQDSSYHDLCYTSRARTTKPAAAASTCMAFSGITAQIKYRLSTVRQMVCNVSKQCRYTNEISAIDSQTDGVERLEVMPIHKGNIGYRQSDRWCVTCRSNADTQRKYRLSTVRQMVCNVSKQCRYTKEISAIDSQTDGV